MTTQPAARDEREALAHILWCAHYYPGVEIDTNHFSVWRIPVREKLNGPWFLMADAILAAGFRRSAPQDGVDDVDEVARRVRAYGEGFIAGQNTAAAAHTPPRTYAEVAREVMQRIAQYGLASVAATNLQDDLAALISEEVAKAVGEYKRQ